MNFTKTRMRKLSSDQVRKLVKSECSHCNAKTRRVLFEKEHNFFLTCKECDKPTKLPIQRDSDGHYVLDDILLNEVDQDVKCFITWNEDGSIRSKKNGKN